MEKVCESLAPTFEKLATFNELKVAQKETENYVKSIKKFNVRTKINQEYSDRILKLEKSIDFLERTNEKTNRLFRTPIIEEAKRIEQVGQQSGIRVPSPAVKDKNSSNNSVSRNSNSNSRSGSWSSAKGLDFSESEVDTNNVSSSSAVLFSSPTTAEGVRSSSIDVNNKLEMNGGTSSSSSKKSTDIDSSRSSATTSSSSSSSSSSLSSSSSSTIASSNEKVPFQEKVMKPSWMKDKSEENRTTATTTTTSAAEEKGSKGVFQERVLTSSWSKAKLQASEETKESTSSLSDTASAINSRSDAAGSCFVSENKNELINGKQEHGSSGSSSSNSSSSEKRGEMVESVVKAEIAINGNENSLNQKSSYEHNNNGVNTHNNSNSSSRNNSIGGGANGGSSNSGSQVPSSPIAAMTSNRRPSWSNRNEAAVISTPEQQQQSQQSQQSQQHQLDQSTLDLAAAAMGGEEIHDSTTPSSAPSLSSKLSSHSTSSFNIRSSTTTNRSVSEKVLVEKKVLTRAPWIRDPAKPLSEHEFPPSLSSPSIDRLDSSSPASAFGPPSPSKLGKSSFASRSTDKIGNTNNSSSTVAIPIDTKPPSTPGTPVIIPSPAPDSSTIVKSIVTQINLTKKMNSSFYEKKEMLQSNTTSSYVKGMKSSLDSLMETGNSNSYDEHDDIRILELNSASKRSWKDLTTPQYVQITNDPSIDEKELRNARYLSKQILGGNSRNGSFDSSSGPDSITGKDGKQLSKHEFSGKSWKDLITETHSKYDPIDIPPAPPSPENKSKGSQPSSPSHHSKQQHYFPTDLPPAVEQQSQQQHQQQQKHSPSHHQLPTQYPSSHLVIDQPSSSKTANYSVAIHQEQYSSGEVSPTKTLSRTKSDYTPKYQSYSADQADHSSQQQQQVTTQQSPRSTGSKGLVTAVSQNHKQQTSELNVNTHTIVVSSQNSSSSSIVGMKIGGGGAGNDSPASNHSNKYVGIDGIPTRNSNFTDGGKPPQSPHHKAKIQQVSQSFSKDFEIDNDAALQQLLTNAIEKARSDSNASESFTRPSRAESNDSDVAASHTSGVMTIDSKTGQKKRRPTVKGLVKRVNSIFRTSSQQKVEFENTGETIISEQNLTKAQLTYTQEKKKSFIEKKIDQHTTIVTHTPVMKQENNGDQLDFSYIDHIDDVSSVASDEHHHRQHNEAEIEPSPMSSLTNSLTQQQMISTSEEIHQSSSSQHDSTRVISKKMSIKGLIRKTSSMFQKITGTGGPVDVPPRPDVLPPLVRSASDKKTGGIAIQSDSFDIPVVKEDSLSISTRSYHPSDKTAPPTFPTSSKRISDLSLPVETASLGTVDKLIQQQLRSSSQQKSSSQVLKESHDGGDNENDEEDRLSMITDDKFDPNAPNKPKKFKPVKFLKKTFTSMSKMI
jgi:hypothetical protein